MLTPELVKAILELESRRMSQVAGRMADRVTILKAWDSIYVNGTKNVSRIVTVQLSSGGI